jgi:metal-responsive CopG/Arc/MetJ family transcriptional regulator
MNRSSERGKEGRNEVVTGSTTSVVTGRRRMEEEEEGCNAMQSIATTSRGATAI